MSSSPWARWLWSRSLVDLVPGGWADPHNDRLRLRVRAMLEDDEASSEAFRQLASSLPPLRLHAAYCARCKRKHVGLCA